jgi:hypothetical protein
MATEHPTHDELGAFFRGDLPAGRIRAVVLHLVKGCATCRAHAEPFYQTMTGRGGPALTAEEEASYDAAIARSFRAVAEKQRQAADAALSLLTPGELAALRAPSLPLDDLALFETFLQRSWALRYDDPARMVQFAQFAVFVASNLNPLLYGGKRVLDLRCRAWTELSNAQRVADDLDEAEDSLARAAGLFLRGSRAPLLGARLYDVYASLCADRRRFDLALEAIEVLHTFHLERGDLHLAGRALISRGIYTGYRGEQEEAIGLLEQGLSMIDDQREPGLALVAVHSQLCFLVEIGRFDEARDLLARRRGRCEQMAGRVSRVKMCWLQGRIHLGLGELESAEALLLEAKKGFEAVGLGYNAALVSLDLATVHLRQGCAAAAEWVAREAIAVFRALHVHREALAAVLLLEGAVQSGATTAAFLAEVSDFLRRAEKDPTLRFAPPAKPS